MRRFRLQRAFAHALVIATTSLVTLPAQSRPTFEITSIKSTKDRAFGPPSPSRTGAGAFYRPGDNVARLVQFAYEVTNLQVVGGPEFARNEYFEISARAAANVPLDQMRLMVQSLPEDRFNLVVRKERRDMRHWLLSVQPGPAGPSLSRCDDPDNPPALKPIRVPPGAYMPLTGRCAPLSNLASAATAFLGSPVIDRTALTGAWNYILVFRDVRELSGREKELAEVENLAPLEVAIREQLGLRLESGRGPVDVIVIESVQLPSGN